MQIRFADFVFDRDQRLLTKGGSPVRISPKAFQLLAALIEARPKAVTKHDLFATLWPDTFVEEANLKNLIVEIRAALGETSRTPRFIKTVSRFGYAFAAEPETAAFRLIQGRSLIPLGEGEYVIGRARDATVPIDSLLISRHHARIIVAGDRATIEDLGSKNGTLVNGRRIEAATELADGDEIILADDVALRVRTARSADSTATAPRIPRK